MVKYLLMVVAVLLCSSVHAKDVEPNKAVETYLRNKQRIVNQITACLDGVAYSSPYNGCLRDGAKKFLTLANLEVDKQISKAAHTHEKDFILKNQSIYLTQIKQCENYTELSYDGHSISAICQLRTAQDYYLYIKGIHGYIIPDDLSIYERVTKYHLNAY